MFLGICKDLILDLGSMEDHMPSSRCTPLHSTITLNFHNLVPLIGRRFLLNLNLVRSLNIYLAHGHHRLPLQDLGMLIQRPSCRHLIRVMLVLVPHLACICIPLSILVSTLACLSFILMNIFTNNFHRYGNLVFSSSQQVASVNAFKAVSLFWYGKILI